MSESAWLVADRHSPSGFTLCTGRRGIGYSLHSLSVRDLDEMRAVLTAGVVTEEPEWEYGWRSRFATGGPVFQELEWGSREQAEQSIRDHEVWEADDPEETRLVYELVKRTPAVRAGEWVPVKQEGADDE